IDRLSFCLSGDHRDLPSFPTRRSSDLRELARIEDEALVPNALVELLERVLRIGRRVEGHDDRRLDVRIEEHAEPQLGADHRDLRSEEHTSELQSPYDLVCRLLLEKKKS